MATDTLTWTWVNAQERRAEGPWGSAMVWVQDGIYVRALRRKAIRYGAIYNGRLCGAMHLTWQDAKDACQSEHNVAMAGAAS